MPTRSDVAFVEVIRHRGRLLFIRDSFARVQLFLASLRKAEMNEIFIGFLNNTSVEGLIEISCMI